MTVVTVCIRNPKVGEIAVTAQAARGEVVGAFSQHDHATVFPDEHPTRRFVDNAETQHFNVEFSRAPHVVNGEDMVVLQNR